MPVEGDQIDLEVSKFMSKFVLSLPLVRIKEGVYLIGTKKVQVAIKVRDIFVRIGGGYMEIGEYFRRNESNELENIKHRIRKCKE